MANFLYIAEAMNLYAGDDGPNNSKHLSLMSVKLPMLEEMKQSHHAGGAIGEIEIGGLGVKALTSTFKVTGHDPQLQGQFGLGSRASRPYTVYGAIRNKNGGGVVQLKAVMWGRLGKIEVDDFKRGDLQGHDYEITEILRYALYFDKDERYYWDWAASEYRVGGVSQIDDINALLAIPSAG